MNDSEIDHIIDILREHQPLSTLAELGFRDELEDMEFSVAMTRIIEGAKRGIVTVKDVKPELSTRESRALAAATQQWEEVKLLIAQEGLSGAIRMVGWLPPRTGNALMKARKIIKERPEWEAKKAFLESYASLGDDGEQASRPEFGLSEIGPGIAGIGA